MTPADTTSADGALNAFSRVVGRIYDAALDPDLWPEALAAICEFTNTKSAGLASYDVFDRTPPWQLQFGYDPYWMQLYVDKYLALNPFMDDVAILDSGEQIHASGHAHYATLFESEFYTGWLKPQGLLDGTVLVVERSVNNITTLVIIRSDSQGPIDEASRARVQQLYPHLRRAVLIGRAFEDQRRRLADDAAVLNSLAAGMFLLNARGELVQANAAGEAMLASRSLLKVSGGRLNIAVPAANRALHAALAAGRDGDVGLGGQGTSIPVRGADSAGDEIILHLLPLNAVRQQSIEAGAGAAFVLFARRIERGDTAAIVAFADRFGLTRKEAEVLRTVVEVGGVPQAADVLGLSTATVRTHVTAIFDKSGVRRQADLIRLLMEMKSPFVS